MRRVAERLEKLWQRRVVGDVLYSYGLYSHGICSYGLYSYGRYSYGLWQRRVVGDVLVLAVAVEPNIERVPSRSTSLYSHGTVSVQSGCSRNTTPTCRSWWTRGWGRRS